MNLYRTIFIKSFLAFFIMIVSLTAFVSYKLHGKIDIQVSLLFATILSLIGAALAALFIGSFRKADAEPPWVQPPEYTLVDPITLNNKLRNIRSAQAILIVMLCLLLPYGAFILLLDLPSFLILTYLFIMAIIAFGLSFVTCPRCGYRFHSKRVRKSELGELNSGSKLFDRIFGYGYYYHKGFSRKCLNCGLGIKRNI